MRGGISSGCVGVFRSKVRDGNGCGSTGIHIRHTHQAYTSQECPQCGAIVKKSLSTRTHVCACGCKLQREHAAAINILRKGLCTVGHTEGY
nr:zinc ribbon domain-containing protein [uncultured Thermosynechococcus sp.]